MHPRDWSSSSDEGSASGDENLMLSARAQLDAQIRSSSKPARKDKQSRSHKDNRAVASGKRVSHTARASRDFGKLPEKFSLRGVWNLKRAYADAPSWFDRQINIKKGSSSVGFVKVAPSFLCTNSTSHTWVLGGLAEIIDNSVDAKATRIDVDVGEVMLYRDNGRFKEKTVEVLDNGMGMTLGQLQLALGLGHSMNKEKNSIGGYGNGLKSGAMRIGAVLMILSRSRTTGEYCAGLYSYLYNTREKHDSARIPVVGWDSDLNPYPNSSEEWREAFAAIVKWGAFETPAEIMSQLRHLPRRGGTKIIVTCLWTDATNMKYELDFDTYSHDILIREPDDSMPKRQQLLRAELFVEENGGGMHALELAKRKQWDIAKLRSEAQDTSLNMYLSILYLKHRHGFEGIWLRGKYVEPHSVLDDMKEIMPFSYKPKGMEGKVMSVHIGFAKEAPQTAARGFYVYQRGRLVMQLDCFHCNWSTGKGVVGMVHDEERIMSWTHTKQDILDEMKKPLITQLRRYIKTYWGQKAYRVGYKEERHRKKALRNGEMDYVGSEDEGSDVDRPLALRKSESSRRKSDVSGKRKATRPPSSPTVLAVSDAEEPPAKKTRSKENGRAAAVQPQMCSFCARQIDPTEYSDKEYPPPLECSKCLDMGRDPPNACHFFCAPDDVRMLASESYAAHSWECEDCKAVTPSRRPKTASKSELMRGLQEAEMRVQAAEARAIAAEKARTHAMEAEATARGKLQMMQDINQRVNESQRMRISALEAALESFRYLRKGVKDFLTHDDVTRAYLREVYGRCQEDGLRDGHRVKEEEL